MSDLCVASRSDSHPDVVLDEPVYNDDKPMYGSYLYIVDGKVTECTFYRDDVNSGITVGEYKRRTGATEVRRCDINKRFPEIFERERSDWDRNFHTQMGDDMSFRGSMESYRRRLIGTPHHRSVSGRTIVQARRRPRTSNKIKKVK